MAAAKAPSPPLVATTLVNGLGGDPAVYGFFAQAGAALLFDLGDLAALPTKELLRVRLVLVSHTHLDHFIGFDRLLRVNIPHQRTLELIGPPGIIANVQGKLRGYIWNLIGPDHLQFIVHEVDPAGLVTSARLRNQHGFAAEPWARAGADGSAKSGTGTGGAAAGGASSEVAHGEALARGEASLDAADVEMTSGDHANSVKTGEVRPLLPPYASFTAPFAGLRIDAVALDHKTPSLAFACQLARRLHVQSDVLAAEGLAPGPWIRELQMAYTQQARGQTCRVGDQIYSVGELGDRIFASVAPRPLAYVTDIGFSRANLDRLRGLLAGVDRLICEANYRDGEVGKAAARMHLTTRQAALIAAACGVGELQIFHVSNLYAPDLATSEREAAEYFAHYRTLDQETLAGAVAGELARCDEAAKSGS